MVAFNFKTEFAPKIISGSKCFTLRAPAKTPRPGIDFIHGQRAKVGETLQLYTGMRSSNCVKLADVVCTSVSPVLIGKQTIEYGWTTDTALHWGHKFIYDQAKFALQDGFDSLKDFFSFHRQGLEPSDKVALFQYWWEFSATGNLRGYDG